MMTVDMTAKNVIIHVWIVSGMMLSIVSMSRENRLTIRPIGVVSKNDSGLRMMLMSMLSWRLRDAWMPLYAIINAYVNTNMAEREIK